MSYIVSWFEDRVVTDHWGVFDTLAEAQERGRELSEKDGVHCWAISRVVSASEPHWVGSQDPEIEAALDAAFAAVFRSKRDEGETECLMK